MKELSKHIQVLLLENDCVIVPGLGGFIAHYRPASKDEEGNFTPQMRTIGFNSRLVMNDGLLAQSYMQAYNTDFPDATRKIEKVVESIKDQIYQQGEATFENIGTLFYNIKGEYEFSPASESFFTPSFYGLQPFRLPILQTENAEETPEGNVIPMPVEEVKTEEDKQIAKVIPMKPIRWWHGVATAAAAILLFFVLSVPAENTYVNENSNQASLGTACLFDAIRSQSMVSTVKTDQDQDKKKTTTTTTTTEKTTEKNNANTLKPTTVKTEVVEEENTQDKTQDNKTKTTTDNQQQPDKSTTDNKQTNTPADNNSNKQSSSQSSSSSTKKTNSTSSESNSVSANKSTTTTSSSSSSSSSSSTLGKLFYVIVSSLTNSSDAEKEVEKLQKAGYTDAKVIESDGRYRVALTSCSSQSEAYNKIEKLKNEGSFEQAWVLNSDK